MAQILCLFGLIPAAAQQNFAQGESLFMQNRPYEALPFLEAAVREDSGNVRAFLYLGMVYEQLEQVEDATATYLRILPRAGAETARVAFNLGNIYYGRGDSDRAEQYYTKAIEADPAYAFAYLNRANSLLRRGALREALDDYASYLTLEPRSPQRVAIEQIRDLALEEFAAEEERKREAEEQRLAEEQAAEEQRLAEEEKARIQAEEAEEIARAEAEAAEEQKLAQEEIDRADAAWKQLLLEDALNSLRNAAAARDIIPAGAGTFYWEAGEFELD